MLPLCLRPSSKWQERVLFFKCYSTLKVSVLEGERFAEREWVLIPKLGVATLYEY